MNWFPDKTLQSECCSRIKPLAALELSNPFFVLLFAALGVAAFWLVEWFERVVTGKALAKIPDREIIDTVEMAPVFTRVGPERKLRLVEALQARGHLLL